MLWDWHPALWHCLLVPALIVVIVTLTKLGSKAHAALLISKHPDGTGGFSGGLNSAQHCSEAVTDGDADQLLY